MTEYGVPPQAGISSTSCANVVDGHSASAAATVFYHSYYGQGHPDAITEHIWMVEIGADNVSISDGAANGL